MSALLRISAFLATLVLTSGAQTDLVHLTHAQATAQLKAAGITWWSSGNCSDRYRAECTSFEQIRAATIAGVITLKQASGCPVMVTGGTETGHGSGTYTHWNGWKVDIQRLACVSAYIRRFSYAGYIPGWGAQYRAPSGNLYTDEGSHWDILYYTCGGCSPTPVATPSTTASPKPSPSRSQLAAPSGARPAGPNQPTGRIRDMPQILGDDPGHIRDLTPPTAPSRRAWAWPRLPVETEGPRPGPSPFPEIARG